jgi:hypothetical protein
MAEPSTNLDRPDYGPSLPELIGPRLRRLGLAGRIALAAGAVAVVIAAVAVLVRSQGEVHTYEQSAADATRRGLAPIEFHLDHSRRLVVSRPPGAYVQLERRQGETLQARFTVSELRLGRQQGQVSGFIPIVATRHERRVARRYRGFRLQFEGRARVNEVEGYQYAFTARLERPGHTARQLFGRVVLLPEPYDLEEPGDPYPSGKTPTRGLVITMLATSLDNVPSATRVGDEGLLQRPYRSFRFGA